MAARTAAIGFSSHSGWAAMVVVAGTARAPAVLGRSRVTLTDEQDPESKQPYHAVEFLCVEEATGRLDGYLEVARNMASAALQAQRAELKRQGISVRSVGIIESSGRKRISLSSILASHALIHAAEGDHFRNALSAAAELLRLRVCRVRARDVETFAIEQLRLPPDRAIERINKLGRDLGPPWGADQKKAALLAWALL
ncbi:MAG TPA: hypothetical protein VHW71_12840 [Steroidobacteraceae bacterium]|jgi:hypothetical protein|nr:hypothetical protein [Steroidobacteraceae bacterium]